VYLAATQRYSATRISIFCNWAGVLGGELVMMAAHYTF